MLAQIYIGLGGNIGDVRSAFRQALMEMVESAVLEIQALSSLYQSSPVGPSDQPDFLNAVIAAQTTLQPLVLLTIMQTLESRQGRVAMPRWGPRPLDLDLLLYDQQIINTPQLSLPHPRLHQRHFVLEPLCEIAPRLHHPLMGRTMTELLAGLPPLAEPLLILERGPWLDLPLRPASSG
ncbi:MAG: 2-amino-4-hydroxy-6-hydroxymethyldihydropteridine pyrophosphokinase [Phycisphaerae bacterium]|nr:2-amino-4-hydroxy-6-hydroxymethyldihydropteridine pyrophosphokinase [Phycisphaerae bacterium]